MSEDEEDTELVLRRQPAVRRKGYIWSSKRTVKRSCSEDRDCNLREYIDSPIPPPRRRGSSLDLTPTLLTIYDSKAAGDTENDHLEKAKLKSQSLPASVSTRVGKGPKVNIQNDFNKRHTVIDPHSVELDDSLSDNRKRPLSISSMSSASSSSLPRQQRKRPNLKEYDHLLIKSDSSLLNGCIKDVNGNTKTEPMDIMSARFERKIHQPGKNDLSGLKHLESFSKKNDHEKSKPRSKTLSDIVSKNEPKTETRNNVKIEVIKPVITVRRSLSDADAYAVTTALENHKASANKKLNLTHIDSDSNGNTLKPPNTHDGAESPVTPDTPDGPMLSKPVPQYVSYVNRVVTEIIETERTYVKSLEDIIQGYLEYLEDNDNIKVGNDDVNCLFSNIRSIYDFSKVFLCELEQCEREPIKVAECFVRNNKGFVIYTEYCTNYPGAVEVLTKFMKDPELSEVFKNRQQKLGHGLPLGAYLLRPVQRILKYHLLLQNIWKSFEKDEVGYDILEQAFKHMTSMAHHINNMKRRHEHAIKIQEIQSQLEDYTGDDLTRLGELVLESSFRVYGARASRHVFLFEKEILICKKKEGGMLSCKSSIQCSNLMLVEVIDNEPLSFHIIPFDNPKAQYTLQARNMEQKRRWCQEIKRLILESYSGKIPEKVKSLVMELGRNHDEDFVSTENLDASRKHQHTAPEYLEKRRVRRKSGGKLPEFHLLKAQKQKRANRRKSPDRRRVSVEGNKDKDRRGRSLDVVPRTGQKKSQSLPRGEMGIFSDFDISDISLLDGTLDSPGVQDSSIDITPEVTKRAQSFRRAVRLGPICSADLSDVKVDLNSKSDVMDIDSETDDPNLTQDHLAEYNDCMFNSRSDLDEETDIDHWKSIQQSQENLENCDSFGSDNTLINGINGDHFRSKSEVIVSPRSTIPTDTDSDTSKSFSDLKNAENGKKLSGLIRGRPRVGTNWLQRKSKPNSENTITAFNDSFRNKSMDSIGKDKSLNSSSSSIVQQLSNESDKLHAAKGSNAKLWSSSDKLLRGSTSSLVIPNHEDPWIKHSDSRSATNISVVTAPKSPKFQHWGRPRNVSDVTDRRTPSRDNLDWMVYVNRNSLNEYPQNVKFLSKYCSPTKNNTSVPKPFKGVWRSESTRSESGITHYLTQPKSLPGNNQNSNSPSKGTNLSRSNSSPCNRKYYELGYGRHRPASLDLETLQESDRIMEEMETYMKHSSNHSLNHAKFPTTAPQNEEEKDLNRLSGVSSISNSSYDSQASHSSSGDNLVGNLKNKIQNWTTKLSKRNEEYEQMSATSSLSDFRPNSEVLSDDEKYDNGPNQNVSPKTDQIEHNQKVRSPSRDLSINLHQRRPVRTPKETDLQTVLLEGSLGSSTVGSKLANNLPPNIEAMYAAKVQQSSPRPHSACILRDTDSLSSYDHSSKEGTPEPSSRLSLPPNDTTHIPTPSLNSSEFQQSDSGFSMQSDDVIDTHDLNELSKIKVSEETHTENSNNSKNKVVHKSVIDVKYKKNGGQSPVRQRKKDKKRTMSNSSEESVDSFYERRLSADLNSDVFRDSAVFCDIDTDIKPLSKEESPQPEPVFKPVRKSIKDYVQLLEEKSKPVPPKTFGVKRREPAAIIKEKLHHLQENSQYRKSSSRSASEERELSPPKSLSEIKSHLSESNNQFRYRRNRAESEHSNDSVCSSVSSTLRSARSLGRLDQLGNDTENLVIMKGWVQQLISKFQSDNK